MWLKFKRVMLTKKNSQTYVGSKSWLDLAISDLVREEVTCPGDIGHWQGADRPSIFL